MAAMMVQREYQVHAVIENKPGARDPEGETIYKDLVLKGGYDTVTSLRVAKLLKFRVRSRTESEATRVVKDLCERLRIFNPAAHLCTVRVEGSRG